MYRFLVSLLLLGCCIGTQADAFNDQPGCFQDLALHFFQPGLVDQALSLHSRYVYQSQWANINNMLQEAAPNIPNIIRNRTARQLKSPLDYPFQPKEAYLLLRSVLFEVWVQVLNQNGVINNTDIKEMFNYILYKQQDRLHACFGPIDLGIPS